MWTKQAACQQGNAADAWQAPQLEAPASARGTQRSQKASGSRVAVLFSPAEQPAAWDSVSSLHGQSNSSRATRQRVQPCGQCTAGAVALGRTCHFKLQIGVVGW